jgi:hypothetical protein
MKELITIAKRYIKLDDLTSLIDLFEAIKDTNIDWQYLFKECYIHACLKKKAVIVEWLTTMYEAFDTVSKIGLRHVFPYGRYLLAK